MEKNPALGSQNISNIFLF